MTSLLVTMEMVYFLYSRSWLPFAFHICGLFILTTLFVYIVVMERDQLIDTPKVRNLFGNQFIRDTLGFRWILELRYIYFWVI